MPTIQQLVRKGRKVLVFGLMSTASWGVRACVYNYP